MFLEPGLVRPSALRVAAETSAGELHEARPIRSLHGEAEPSSGPETRER